LLRARALQQTARAARAATKRPGAERAGARDVATTLAHAGLPFCAGASIAAWLLLARWYNLSEKIEIPYFAFEKVPGGFESETLRRTLLLFIGCALLYAVGFVLLASAKRMTLTLKASALLFMLGPAVVNVFIYPAGALDVFNYMVDLKLAFHYDANPYVETMPGYLMEDPITRSAFLLHIPLFYGPAWLLLSWLPAAITGFEDIANLLLGLKTFNVVLLAISGFLIARAQPTERRRWLAPFVLLANPLVVFEGIGNAHNDVMMTVFLVAAVYAMTRRRAAVESLSSFALSVLVKPFTLALAPLMVVEAVRRRLRIEPLAAGLLLTTAVILAAAAPFWDDGAMWRGIREGSRLSQRMDHVSPYSLAQQRLKEEIASSSPANAHLRQYASADVVPKEKLDRLERRFTIAFAALALLVLAGRFFNLLTFERAAAVTLILFALLLTNLYPWYLIPIIALLAMELRPVGVAYAMVAALLGLCYYPAYVWAHFHSGWPKLEVHLFFAALLTAPLIAFLVVVALRVALFGSSAARASAWSQSRGRLRFNSKRSGSRPSSI
jgi:hypothetical protein